MSSAAKPVVKKVATKKESAPVAAAAVAAPVAPVAAVAAPAAAPAKKVSKKAEASASVAAPAAANAVVAPEPIAAASEVAAPAASEPTTTLAQDIESLTLQLQSVRDAAVSGLKALGKLQKRAAREVKEAGRRRRRNRAAPVEGAAPVAKRPTIFTTPVTLRDGLCSFLGKPSGSQMTPADVTRAFSAYVDSHKLKDAEKGHTIHPDAAMRKVLGVKEGEALTYRNIQTYLYKLYVLPEKKAAAPASA
jgi:chromatin remodeling complex protein RSC6